MTAPDGPAPELLAWLTHPAATALQRAVVLVLAMHPQHGDPDCCMLLLQLRIVYIGAKGFSKRR